MQISFLVWEVVVGVMRLTVISADQQEHDRWFGLLDSCERYSFIPCHATIWKENLMSLILMNEINRHKGNVEFLISMWLLFGCESGGPCGSPSPVQLGGFLFHLTAHFCANGYRLCSYVCQIHLSTWKCWKTHSSPVFDKSYYKTSLHVNKKKNFIPYFKTAVNTFQTSLFHNNNNNNDNHNNDNNNNKIKPTWSIN